MNKNQMPPQMAQQHWNRVNFIWIRRPKSTKAPWPHTSVTTTCPPQEKGEGGPSWRTLNQGARATENLRQREASPPRGRPLGTSWRWGPRNAQRHINSNAPTLWSKDDWTPTPGLACDPRMLPTWPPNHHHQTGVLLFSLLSTLVLLQHIYMHVKDNTNE